MKQTLEIAPGLHLPLEAVTQAIGVLAKRRAGKSYTARRIAEQFLKCGQQVVMVDPKGDQWGIRSSADGKSPGFPVVIVGGERGDVKLEPGSGEIIAKLVVEERVSVLLDLSLLRKHEVATFMTGFLENLYRLKAQERYRTPMMLIIDEADAIAPQKPQKGEERMLGASEDIVRRGGQRGIGCMLVTQRSAVLNKNVLTQVQVLIVLRTIAPQDLAAMDAWIDVHGTDEQRKMLRESLPSLPVGDAWFWSPGWPSADGIFKRVHVLPIETFDSGATPKVGEKRVEPRNLADVDLEALQRQMAETIERAKADDPKELKRKIAELQKQLAKPQPIAAPTPAAADPERLKKEFERGAKSVKAELGKQLRAYQKAVDQRLLDSQSALVQANRAIAGLLDKLPELPPLTFPDLEEIIANADKLSPPPVYGTPSGHPVRAEAAPRKPVQRSSPPAERNGNLSGPEQRIVDAIAWLEDIGIPAPEQTAVAFLAGYTTGGGAFNNPRGALRGAGYLDYVAGDRISLTDAGRNAANHSGEVLTAQEIQSRVLSRLPGPEQKILRVAIEAYPESVRNDDCARAAGYEPGGGAFNNPRGRLRSLGLIEYPSPGQIRARPLLFLE